MLLGKGEEFSSSVTFLEMADLVSNQLGSNSPGYATFNHNDSSINRRLSDTDEDEFYAVVDDMVSAQPLVGGEVPASPTYPGSHRATIVAPLPAGDDQYGYNYDHPDYADNSNYFFYRCDLYFNIALAVLIVIFLIVIVYKLYELYFSGSDDDGSVTYVSFTHTKSSSTDSFVGSNQSNRHLRIS